MTAAAFLREQEEADRRRDQVGARRPQVPLRHARQHPQGGQARRRDDGLREAIMTKMEKPTTLSRRAVLMGAGALVVSVGAPIGLDTLLGINAALAQGAKPPLTPDQLSSYIAVNADGTRLGLLRQDGHGPRPVRRHRPDRGGGARRAVQGRQGLHGRHRHQREPGRRLRLDRHPVRRQADAHGRGRSAPRAGRDGRRQARHAGRSAHRRRRRRSAPPSTATRRRPTPS